MPHSCNIPNLVGHTIDNGCLKFTKILGSGSNGVIYLAEDITTSPPEEFAVKCMIRGEKSTRRYGLQRQEVQFHSMLSPHPNVVTLHRIIEDKYYLFMVMDYIRGGDFFTFLSQRRDYRGDDVFVRKSFLQILDVLQACHDSGVYHRDIKPENFLISEDGTHLYLTDFGLATANLWSKTYGAGSSLYMSPECIGTELMRPPYNTCANDVWALGVILTSMISGHNPWNRACSADACFRAYSKNPNFLRDMLPISVDANRLLQQIFRHEHARRITLPQLCEAVKNAESFFMSPREIVEAGEYLRSAAQSYYGGSARQQHFIPWSSATSLTAVGEDHGNSYGEGMRPEKVEKEYVDVGVEEMDLADEGRRHVFAPEESPSSTLETDGPDTPELRAQQLHAVDIPDDAFSPYGARPAYAAKDAEEPASKKMQSATTASPSFLRRFMDRFLVE